MGLVFISINEKLESGLLQSQFVKPAESLLSENTKITVINIHRPFFNAYKNDNLRVVNLPILFPFRFINFTCLFFLNELLTLFYAFAISVVVKKGDILCCRGYVAGLSGSWLNKILGMRYIFDPRSLYVHENIGVYLNLNTYLYRYWLYVESRIIKRAMKTISVSVGQNDYYINKYLLRSSNTVVIPCYASQSEILSSCLLDDLKVKLGYTQEDIIVGYIGSLNNGWNNISLYKKYFKHLLNLGYKVLVISQDKTELLKDTFFNDESIRLLAFGEIVGNNTITTGTIQVADYGIVLMDKTHDWFTRLTVKFVDYTSNGLPVIVHENVGEAQNLMKDFDISPSFSVVRPEDISVLFKPTKIQKKKIFEWAKLYFSVENSKNILK